MQDITTVDWVLADLKHEEANVWHEKQAVFRLFDDGKHGDGRSNDGL